MFSPQFLNVIFDGFEEAILLDTLPNEGYEDFRTFVITNIEDIRTHVPQHKKRAQLIASVILRREALRLGAVKWAPESAS